jgi:hypothetical protein
MTLNELSTFTIIPTACSQVSFSAFLTADPTVNYTLNVRATNAPLISNTGAAIGLTCVLGTGAARACSVSGTHAFAAGDAVTVQIVGTAAFNTAPTMDLTTSFLCK